MPPPYPAGYIWHRDTDIIEPVYDLLQFGLWFTDRQTNRHLAFDVIGDAQISTIFLGIDHNLLFGGTPILWETMIFNGPLDNYQMRYCTKEEALENHRHLVEVVKKLTTRQQPS